MFNLDPRSVDARKPIASGSFGTIHAYIDDKKNQNKKWVVKCIPAKNTKELRFFIQEILLGFNHKHPCVVSNRGYDLKDSPEGGWRIYIKQPRMEKSLKMAIGDHVRAKTKPALNDVIKYFYNIASGLEYLESKRIIHNNINPGTILIDNENVARVGGIGLGQHKPYKKEQSNSGTDLYTAIYMAPERLQPGFVLNKDNAFKGDVWSLGLTIVELCLGELKKYYPGEDDDDDKKEVNVDDDNWLFGSEEEKKVSEEEKRKTGTVQIEKNLENLKKQYDKKLGDIEEDATKFINILQQTFKNDPKMRPSFTEICTQLDSEFPELNLKNEISTILNDRSRYEEEENESGHLFFYGDGDTDSDSFSYKNIDWEDSEGSVKIFQPSLESDQTGNKSDPSLTQQDPNLNFNSTSN